MTDNGALSQNQKRLLAALLDSRSIREAAQKANITERTAFRYLSDGRVRQAVAEQQDVLLSVVTSGIVADMAEARSVLVSTMQSKTATDGVRVRAAGIVLQSGLKLFELLTLADRVSALERRVESDK